MLAVSSSCAAAAYAFLLLLNVHFEYSFVFLNSGSLPTVRINKSISPGHTEYPLEATAWILLRPAETREE